MNEFNAHVTDVAMRAATAAAEILRKYSGTAQVKFKGHETQNLVTQADLEAEAAILTVIRQSFPDHKVLCEESDATGGSDSEHLWIVDPLDGTTNYAHGIPQFCTAIAYASRGVVQLGVVLDPMRNEMFHAVRGEGAFLNDQAIHVSDRKQLNEAVIATGFYYDRGEMMQRTLHAIERLFQHNIHGIRRFGGAALDQCWVACGRFEAFFEYQLSPWDYAAASVIVEEAGGRCGDRTGTRLEINSGSVIVSNAELYEAVCDIVRW